MVYHVVNFWFMEAIWVLGMLQVRMKTFRRREIYKETFCVSALYEGERESKLFYFCLTTFQFSFRGVKLTRRQFPVLLAFGEQDTKDKIKLSGKWSSIYVQIFCFQDICTFHSFASRNF